MYADMHIHSSESDGKLKPEEIIRTAQEIKNLKAISITDHDTAEGSRIAQKYKQSRLEVISGIEFSCEVNFEEVHILGYFIDTYNTVLLQMEKRLLNIRSMRIEKFIDKLNEQKIFVSSSDVYKYATGKAVGRPHLAQAIFNKGYAASIEEAYSKYLLKGSPTYVPRAKMIVQEAMDIINISGGIGVIAHPSSIKNQDTITQIINMGIEGLEVFHPMNTEQYTKKYLKLANENKLLITGGSDFHYSRREDRASIGEYNVEYHHIEKMKDYIKNIRK